MGNAEYMGVVSRTSLESVVEVRDTISQHGRH